jgi:hypothetical protein
MKLKYKKRIAPRLASGDSRDSIGHGLPPEIKEGLRAIAFKENESLSWILEKIIIAYFGFKKPEYVEIKNEKHIQKPDKSTKKRAKKA